ncbi:hypothetical protein [Halanaerobacter jeridensis]|uniref:Uncharacterized protein n=1 Tax=Halanaerobacter jeridensis TaxID=706427 RepID=A0A938XT20_9FIRM|nr:hypothetical protein [Halanaerobacter jeridensis]MBM7557206.1 hypothetical protein [Halanaerobacter jeridensis]
MISILAGLIASMLAFLFNRFLFSKLGDWTIVYLVPIGEEIFKSGFAYYLGANLVMTHLIFGVLEAGFDFFHSNKLAVVLAVLTHLLLGSLTFYCWTSSNNLIIAIVIAALVHTVWNYSIRRVNYEINL